MSRNRIDEKDYSRIAKQFGIDKSDVRSIVTSFFDILQSEAKRLPFDNETRIFSRDKFNDYSFTYMIPFVGRFGPVYSRYLLWRRNESENLVQVSRSYLKKDSEKVKAERLAEKILFGKTEDCNSEEQSRYKRIWMVSKDGKKLARQVIPQNEE